MNPVPALWILALAEAHQVEDGGYALLHKVICDTLSRGGLEMRHAMGTARWWRWASRSCGILISVISVTACGHDGAPPTALADAARRGDLAEIDGLVAAGADVDQPSGRADWPPLIHAIHKGRTAAVSRLLVHGASVAGDAGRRALLMASGYGDVETVRLLLARGVQLPRTAEEGASLIAAAVGGAWDIDYEWTGCERHTQVVRLLLAADSDLRVVRELAPRSIARARATFQNRVAEMYVRRKGCSELLRLLN